MRLRHRFPVAPAVFLGIALLLATGAAPAHATPPNDDFEDAVRIRLGEAIAGTTSGATSQPEEPPPRLNFGQSVWYRFRTTERGASVLLGTCAPSGGNTAVSVYTGRSLTSLRLIDSGAFTCSGGGRVAFKPRAGRTYWIAVTGYGAPSFRLRARRIKTPPNDDFRDATEVKLDSLVSASTRNATLEWGEPNNGPPSVWFSLRVDRSRQIALTNIRTTDRDCPQVAVFAGPAVARLSEVVSGECRLRFAARPRVTYRIQITDKRPGRAFTFRASAS
jgi:hypothetical protein